MAYFKNKVVIVTGSSMGIGKQLAGQLAAAGARVVLNARNKERLVSTLEEFLSCGYDFLAVPGDVSKPEDCQVLIEEALLKYGRIDALINNAGISTQGTLEILSPEVYQKLIEVNFLGSVFPTKAALPHLRKSKGSVMFVSSVAGIRGIPGHSGYCTSKMALTALADALKIEEKSNQVHVGIAYVGFTENDPQKVIYDPNGKLIAQPEYNIVKREKTEVVAKKILNMIEKRKESAVFTPLGLLTLYVSRFMPKLGDWILARQYKKNQQQFFD